MASAAAGFNETDGGCQTNKPQSFEIGDREQPINPPRDIYLGLSQFLSATPTNFSAVVVKGGAGSRYPLFCSSVKLCLHTVFFNRTFYHVATAGLTWNQNEWLFSSLLWSSVPVSEIVCCSGERAGLEKWVQICTQPLGSVCNFEAITISQPNPSWGTNSLPCSSKISRAFFHFISPPSFSIMSLSVTFHSPPPSKSLLFS